MNFPSSQRVRTYESSFEVAHSEAREKGFSGSLVLRSGTKKGVVVYLEGWPIYAKYNNGRGDELHAQDAIDSLNTVTGSIDRHPSEPNMVEMFRTYMGYIDREEGEINVYKVRDVEIPERTILVTQGGELNKVKAPRGERVGYSPNEEYLKEYFEENEVTGYALSNDEAMFFEDGHMTRREKFKEDGLSIVVRMQQGEDFESLEVR
ncbi:MAG: hypothetical protein SXQ77_11685 [Halobacteria archaeon]|nr:hypothetical protein [Halobacteria archaeon]